MTTHLTGVPMVIKVMQWKIEEGGETRTGNWIGAVSPKKGAAPLPKAKPAVTEEAPF